jgi:hypothetical protein
MEEGLESGYEGGKGNGALEMRLKFCALSAGVVALAVFPNQDLLRIGGEVAQLLKLVGFDHDDELPFAGEKAPTQNC